MEVFIINGPAGAGKDTFIEQVASLCKLDEVVSYSYADEAKRLATFAGWEGTKTEADRRFLAELCDSLQSWADIPFRACIRKYEEEVERGKCKLLFFHVRKPGDIHRMTCFFREKFGVEVQTIYFYRDVKEVHSNIADSAVYSPFNYDIAVNNQYGLYELLIQARNFVNKYIGGVTNSSEEI